MKGAVATVPFFEEGEGMLRIVKTENGMVKGLPAADPRITSFKGIPFAAPPVGKNRYNIIYNNQYIKTI